MLQSGFGLCYRSPTRRTVHLWYLGRSWYLLMVEVASGVTSPAIAGREDVGEDTPRLAPRLAVARSGDLSPW